MMHTSSLLHTYLIRSASLDDVSGAVDLFNACARDIIGVEESTVDDLKREWRTPGFNLETDTRIICTPDGKILGYFELWDSGHPHTPLFTWGRVHPEHKENGVGAYLLSWAEERARQVIPLAPKGSRVVLRAFLLSQDQASASLFLSRGFDLIRYNLRMIVHLNGAPPVTSLPERVSIRPFKGETELPEVVQVVRASFQDHWGWVERSFDIELARHRQYIQEDPHFDPSLWFVAEDDGGQIVGISLCRPNITEDPDMGWVSTLGVIRDYRRRGLGMALLQHSFAEFYRRGVSKIGLGVDASSLTGATRLYEKAGMKSDPNRMFAIYEKELRPGLDLSTTRVE